MLAIDTNVAARLLLNDNVEQALRAREIVDAGVFLPATVILELCWLLTSRYHFDRVAVADLVTGLMSLPTVSIENSTRLQWALRRFAERGDIADLIHIASSGPATTFATFDRRVATAAGNKVPVTIASLA